MLTLRKHVVTTLEAQVVDEMRRAAKRAKAKRPPRNLERAEQIKFVRWARKHGLCVLAPLLELSSRSKAQGALYKSMGAQAGAADVLVLDEIPGSLAIRGLAVEFKTLDGVLRPSQKEWAEVVMRRCGWQYWVAYSADQAIAHCRALGLGVAVE